MKKIHLILLLLALTLAVACAKNESPQKQEVPLERPKPRPYPNELPDSVKNRVLSNSFKLPQELFDNVLLALEKRDTMALIGMMITEK